MNFADNFASSKSLHGTRGGAFYFFPMQFFIVCMYAYYSLKPDIVYIRYLTAALSL